MTMFFKSAVSLFYAIRYIGVFLMGFCLHLILDKDTGQQRQELGFRNGMDYAIQRFVEGKLLKAPDYKIQCITDCILVQVVEPTVAPIHLGDGGLIQNCSFYTREPNWVVGGTMEDWDRFDAKMKRIPLEEP